MNPLRVWAPRAQRVQVELGSYCRDLARSNHGWWRLPDPQPPAGTDYRFIVDGQEATPDPRSAHQPAGVHGPSRVVDHGAFAWSDHEFRAPPLASGVVYELHVGTFSPEGTFDGVIPRLRYLRELGVTHVELMPVNQFPGRHGWGYDGVGWYAVHDAYGGPEGLKRLVNACHEHGLAVLLDVVYNHLGPDGNYLGTFGPYFADAYSTFWGPALNLDQAYADEVRRFICDNALMWLRDYHLDGLRLDAVHAFFDRSAVHLLEQLASEVDELQTELMRPLVLIAESDLNDPRVVRSRDAGGFGLDAQWSDDLHHALHALLTREHVGYYSDFGTLGHLARAIRNGYVYEGQYAPARKRCHGRPTAGVPRSRFLGYLQTHDQVGNRARGERIGHLTTADRVRIGAALYLTSPSVPMLFQGEEWNASTPFCYFTDHTKPGLADIVRNGRRAEFAAFGWDPEQIPDPNDPETFARSQLQWSERDTGDRGAMLTWYRALLRLRRERPELRGPVTDVRFDEGAGWLLVERPTTLVVAHLGPQPCTLELDASAVLLAAPQEDVHLDGGRLTLPRDSIAILYR